jgi:hypothetical protein
MVDMDWGMIKGLVSLEYKNDDDEGRRESARRALNRAAAKP